MQLVSQQMKNKKITIQKHEIFFFFLIITIIIIIIIIIILNILEERRAIKIANNYS